MRNSVLTLTFAGDSHAAIVGTGLEKLGVQHILHAQPTTAGKGNVSIDFLPDGQILEIGTEQYYINSRNTFWNRRDPHVYILPDQLHDADHKYTSRMLRSTFNGLRALLDQTFAVNPSAARDFSSSKLRQLHIAQRSGAIVPETIVSNNFNNIAEFRSRFPRTCMKGFGPFTWQDEGGHLDAGTFLLEQDFRLDPDSVAVCPFIYQEFIEKAYEVRVTAFGNFICASKISIKGGVSDVDWKKNARYLQNIEPISPPASIVEIVREVMKGLGIRFGAFDFAVREDGSWVFLEVNESGQFLWQEEFCPDCIVLEPFCRFLSEVSDDFQWEPSSRDPAFSGEQIASEVEGIAKYAQFLSESSPSPESMGLYVRETSN